MVLEKLFQEDQPRGGRATAICFTVEGLFALRERAVESAIKGRVSMAFGSKKSMAALNKDISTITLAQRLKILPAVMSASGYRNRGL